VSITHYPALVRIAPDGNTVTIGGTSADAFGRARTSAPFTLFDSQNRYAKNDLFSESTATGGAVSYLANESTVEMTTTTSSGSEVIRESKRVFSYQPGKSLLVLNTFVMSAPQTNLRCRIGYFSTQNGVFFERNNSTLNIVRRSYVTGSVVDTAIAQSNWNGDKLDGTGSSGYTLDTTKAQIFWMDFEWLGVGSVRCGFVINGQFIVAHTFNHANTLSTVYMTTAILPIRHEITNTAATASAASLKQICSTVISEGGYERRVALYTASMTAANGSISTNWIPLVSIRLDPSRLDSVVVPDGYTILPTSASSVTFEVALFKNATLTSPSWTQTESDNVEFDISATGLTGGRAVYRNFVLASNMLSGNTTTGNEYNFDLQLGRTLAGVSDIYTIAIRSLSGTHTAIGSMSFWDLT
jgi:hypothetical protein